MISLTKFMLNKTSSSTNEGLDTLYPNDIQNLIECLPRGVEAVPARHKELLKLKEVLTDSGQLSVSETSFQVTISSADVESVFVSLTYFLNYHINRVEYQQNGFFRILDRSILRVLR